MLELINNNVGCVYKEYISMLTNLKQVSMNEEEFIRELEKYINPRVLFLDDFLKGEVTSADRKYIYKVINTRYLKGKPMIISTLVKVIRENLYTERDERCLDEYLCYEKKPNGAFGAITGKHDDLLMTRAIGLHICFFEMDTPKIVPRVGRFTVKRRKKAVSAATI